MKVNVPFNFNDSYGWMEMLERYGAKVEKIHSGIDQPTVPEYHVILIATKVRD